MYSLKRIRSAHASALSDGTYAGTWVNYGRNDHPLNKSHRHWLASKDVWAYQSHLFTKNLLSGWLVWISLYTDNMKRQMYQKRNLMDILRKLVHGPSSCINLVDQRLCPEIVSFFVFFIFFWEITCLNKKNYGFFIFFSIGWHWLK